MSRFRIICGLSPTALTKAGVVGACGAVCDPPYSSGGQVAARKASTGEKYGGDKMCRLPDFIGDGMSDRVLLNFTNEWMYAIRLIAPDGVLFCFHDWRNWAVFEEAGMRSGWDLRAQLVWEKPMGMVRVKRNGWHGSTERILYSTNGQPFYHEDRFMRSEVLRYAPPKPAAKIHQTEKPVGLLTELLIMMPDIDLPVIDLFAGSGSLGLAAAGVGRDVILVEANADYCAIIRERMLRVADEDLALGEVAAVQASKIKVDSILI